MSKMDDLEIVYSDEEGDILDRIYFLCDIDEQKEVTPEINIDDFLRQDEEEVTLDVTTTPEEKIVNNEQIGEKVVKLLELAIQEKIPQRYIFYDENENVVDLKQFLKGKNATEGLQYIIRNYFRITISDYILIYYLSNMKDMEEGELLGNLNELKNISNREFDKSSLLEYKREVRISMDEIMKSMIQKLERITTFFTNINSLPFSNSPEDIERTIELEETEVEFFVRDGEFPFDIDSGGVVFDNMKTSNTIPFIAYNSFTEEFYKVNEDTDDLSVMMDDYYQMEDKKENHIYFYIRIQYKDSQRIKLVSVDLEESKIRVGYPGNSIGQVKELLSRAFPDIVYVHEKKTFVKGNFSINFPDYEEINVRYLCLMDDMFSNFLYVKENANPRSLRKNIKYFYKTYEENSGFSDHSVSFTMDKIHANRYLVNFRSRIIKKDSISEFMLTLSKLISYYSTVQFSDTPLDIIKNRYTGPDGEGLGGEYQNEDQSYAKFSSKKIDILSKKAPGMFPTSLYGKSCPCIKQPIIIDDKDVEAWENYTFDGDKKKNVVVFPPENSDQKSKKFNFVCPENQFPYVYFMKNPSFGEKFPILPCCGMNKPSSEYIDDYDQIRADEVDYWASRTEKRVRRENQLKTVKILATDQLGILPKDLDDFLQNIKKTSYTRRGVIKNNTSSMIHCLIYASSHLEKMMPMIDPANENMRSRIGKLISIRKNYMERKTKDREALVNMFRNNIRSFVNIESCSQETYQYDTPQVTEMLMDKEKIFDSELFFRLLEHIFMINIFVFRYENGTTTLEKPRHNLFHIRQFRKNFPSIILLKHISYRTIPTYEIIQEEKSELYFEEGNVLDHMKNMIRRKNYTLASCVGEKGFDILKNGYSGVDWSSILGDYQILSQDVNDSGRLIKINISIGRGERMSIFVRPSVPLNVKISRVIYEAKKDDVIDVFGEEFTTGSQGLWYSITEFSEGVFIPCRGVRESSQKKKCLEYELLRNISVGNKEINSLITVKKNANIIKQVLVWLWSISDIEDVDEWFSIYTDEMKEKRLIDIINVTPIKMDYRFPTDIRSVEQGIDYLENYMPVMFSLGKIHLYEQLMESMKRYIKNYQISLEGIPKQPNKSIVNIFNVEKDFRKYAGTRIILGKDNYEQYYNNIKADRLDIEKIPDEYSVKSSNFTYRSSSDGRYFLVQNNITDREKEAILCVMIWKKWRVNLGYDLDRHTLWNKFQEYPFLLEFFNYTQEEIILFSNEQNPIETTDYTEALYFLTKNRVAIPDDKISSDVSIRYRSSEGISEKKADSDETVDIWIYGNGAHAAMLNIN